MPEALLPLFPLELVLLPGAPLPLHIFEDRYKEMIGEAVRDRTEFGVVQASDKGILNIGCTATVEKVLNHYPDGRMDILAQGRRRFEIELLNQERAYLRAAVSFFADEDLEAPAADLKAVVLAAFRTLQETGDLAIDDPLLSFSVAQAIPDLRLRQLLLATRSEAERLKQLAEFLPQFVVKQRRTEIAHALAPRNGHAKFDSGNES